MSLTDDSKGFERNLDRIVLATRNKGKIAEIERILSSTPIALFSLNDFPSAPEVVEDGATFEENALKKARVTAGAVGVTALADDSGLCVDALSGRPGVMSARYGGKGCDDRQRFERILEELKSFEDPLRTARFVCVLALVSPNGAAKVFKGVCEGRILKKPEGKSGFGYDPIFYHEELGRSFGELSLETKNSVSHRGRALRLFADFVAVLRESAEKGKSKRD